MIEQKSKDVSLSNIELEGNIGEDSSKKVNVIETTKPSEQTQAAFGYFIHLIFFFFSICCLFSWSSLSF